VVGEVGPVLGELNREVLADVERRLSLGDKGQPLVVSTAGRYRKVAHSCIRRAVELDRLKADPWPPAPKGRSRRKARRKRSAVDVRVLPSPETMVAIMDAIPSHQPGSRMYQAMTAAACYAGLRPSEVVMLRPRALQLSATGWGSVEVGRGRSSPGARRSDAGVHLRRGAPGRRRDSQHSHRCHARHHQGVDRRSFPRPSRGIGQNPATQGHSR